MTKAKIPAKILVWENGGGRQTIKDRKGQGRKGTWFTKEKEDDWIWILGLGNRTQLGRVVGQMKTSVKM